MAPTENFLKAAKEENRHPTVLVRVESSDSAETLYTTKGDWDGSDTLAEIRTAKYEILGSGHGDFLGDTGDAWHKADNGYTLEFAGDLSYLKVTALYDAFFTGIMVNMSVIGSSGNIDTRLRVDNSLSSPTETYYSKIKNVNYTFLTGSTYSASNIEFEFRFANEILNTEIWYIYPEVFIGGTWVDANTIGTFLGTNQLLVTKESAQIITSAIDVGSILAQPPIFSIDDTEESGSSISYSYTYSDDDISYLSGGTIGDGDPLTAARYYKIQADLTTTNGGRGLISEIIIAEGAFLDFGTHKDTPINGVKPYLKKDSISNLTQKITLTKGTTTTGEQSVKMFWLPDVEDMIVTGYLKGKDVSIQAGFVGLDLIDYLPIFVGTWYDNDFDDNGEPSITFKARDILKQFEKRKLPEEEYDATGNKTSIAIPYAVDNIIEVVLDIYDKIGIRSRYITDDYATLQAGALSGPDWNVSRILSKPETAWKLLDQLAFTAGMWLVPQGNGQIKPVLYDRNAAANQDYLIKAGVGDFGPIKGNLKEFFSRYYSYYNPKSEFQVTPDYKDPGGTEDFDNGTALINATAELNWFPESGQKEHLDLWKVGRSSASTALTSPPKALRDLNKRLDSWFTEPLYTVSVKKLPPRFAAVEIGDVLPVSGLRLPVARDAWDIATAYLTGNKIIHSGRMWVARQSSTGEEPIEGSRYWQDSKVLSTGLTEEKRFLVAGRTYNPNTAIIDLDLMEMPPLTRGEVTMAGYTSLKVVDGATSQTGITTTPEILTVWESAGDTSGPTPDAANNKITIDVAGPYWVFFQMSYNGTANITYEMHLRIDSIEEDAGTHRKIGVNNDTGSASFGDVIELDAGDVVTVWVQTSSTGDVSPLDGQLVISQQGA